MRNTRFSIGRKPALLSMFAFILCVTNSYAAKEKPLHSFANNGKDGTLLYSGVVMD